MQRSVSVRIWPCIKLCRGAHLQWTWQVWHPTKSCGNGLTECLLCILRLLRRDFKGSHRPSFSGPIDRPLWGLASSSRDHWSRLQELASLWTLSSSAWIQTWRWHILCYRFRYLMQLVQAVATRLTRTRSDLTLQRATKVSRVQTNFKKGLQRGPKRVAKAKGAIQCRNRWRGCTPELLKEIQSALGTIWALVSRVHRVPGNMFVQFLVATKAILKRNINEVVQTLMEFHKGQGNASFRLWTMNKSRQVMVWNHSWELLVFLLGIILWYR